MPATSRRVGVCGCPPSDGRTQVARSESLGLSDGRFSGPRSPRVRMPLPAFSSVSASKTPPAANGPSIGLVRHMIQRPVWIAGLVIMTLAYVLQAVALHLGTLDRVQPLMVSELVILVDHLVALVFDGLARSRSVLRVRDRDGTRSLSRFLRGLARHGYAEGRPLARRWHRDGGRHGVLRRPWFQRSGVATCAAAGGGRVSGLRPARRHYQDVYQRVAHRLGRRRYSRGRSTRSRSSVLALSSSCRARSRSDRSRLRSPALILVNPLVSIVVGHALFHETLRGGPLYVTWSSSRSP